MSFVDALLAGIGGLLVLYVIARLVFYAWFRSRDDYERKKTP